MVDAQADSRNRWSCRFLGFLTAQARPNGPKWARWDAGREAREKSE
jgi:hypothetical protein